MGTRNLTIVYKNGDYRVAQYGQWDGYPSGLGADILEFLSNINLQEFKDSIDLISFYTAEEMEELHREIEEKQTKISGYRWWNEYPHLSRDCGGEVLSLIFDKKVSKLRNDIDFAADSLFCEWAYVIDLDKNQFEVYQGFNEETLTENERFYCFEEKCKNSYHPIKFVASYDLSNLPSEEEFIGELERDDE